MALIGYCTCETLLSFMRWVGGSFEPGVTFKRDRVLIFVWWRDKHATIETFSQVFFIPMSLYPLMYLDKKRNKDFFFLRGQLRPLSPLCFSTEQPLHSFTSHCLLVHQVFWYNLKFHRLARTFGHQKENNINDGKKYSKQDNMEGVWWEDQNEVF